jgi:hypothetical protein
VHEELQPFGFEVVSVALDEVTAARPWVEEAGVTYTVVADPHHVVADRYGLYNVPSIVWIDEHDRIVRPPDMGFGDNTWQEFTGVDADVHKEELRRWVRDGELPFDEAFVRAHRLRPTPDQQQARLERRVAAWLHRSGRARQAVAHLDRAAALAPMDWTVRRGGMPLRGDDPFGEQFFAFMGEWLEAGAPGYGWGNSLATPGATPSDDV